MAVQHLESLAQIEAEVWRELALAVSSKMHGWRIGVLATVDGEAADARSVVLRDLDPATRTLLIYTDSRSPKARQIAANPQGMLVLWSEPLGWQLRLQLTLTLETAGLNVSSRWARLKLTPAAQDYLSPLPPGSLLGASVPLGWQLRLQLTLTLETAGLNVSSRWARLKLTPAAQDYLSPLPPGSLLGASVPLRQSRDHFAVLAARVLAIDWLELGEQGQRRARFDAAGAAWLTP